MPGLDFSPLVVLLVFYLYLLARWQYVRRPMFYLIGAAGFVFAMISGFIDSVTVTRIFRTIGMMVAFVAAVGACFGAQLPLNLPSGLTGSAPSAPPPSAK